MSLEASSFSLPLARPLATARGELRSRRGFVVKALGPDGALGLGEATPLPPWTEDLKSCGAALEAATEQVDDLDDPEEVLSDLDAFCKPLKNCPAARHGLATALLDLAAQAAEEPLALYLGRTQLRRPLDVAPLPVNALVGALEPKEAAAEAHAALAQGFRTVKVKLTGDADADEARVKAVRAAIGDAELRLDANGAWTFAEAEQRLRALAVHRPAFVEQPLAPEDLGGAARLRALRLVPVAADEAASSLPRARAVLEAGACDVLVLKPSALGGPDRAAEAVRMAEEHKVQVAVSSLLEGPIGLLAAWHVAALPAAPRNACGLATAAMFDPPLPGPPVEEGFLPVPTAPGLGRPGRA